MNCKITEELREIILEHPSTLVNTICKDCEGDGCINICINLGVACDNCPKKEQCETCEATGILKTLEPITISQMLSALEKQNINRSFILIGYGRGEKLIIDGFGLTEISLDYFDKTKNIDQQSLEFKTALLKLLKNDK